MKQEYAYWIALAHLPRMKTARKNELIVRFFEEKQSIVDFFHCDFSQWKILFSLNEKEIELLNNAKSELANYSFLVEDLLEQGYDIIPITSPDYSPIIKNNLKRAYSPPLIYTKGNKQIMKENSIAIVGSRKAEDISLEFTDNVAKTASKDYKVVVSGFAKGVDKQALDSAIKYKGKPLYYYARKGKKVKAEPRLVKINNIGMLSLAGDILTVKINCSSGTYVRSIANEVGKMLGCGAAVKSLTRTRIGTFNVKNSVKLKDFINEKFDSEDLCRKSFFISRNKYSKATW